MWVELVLLPKHAALACNTLTHLPESAESGHARLETCGCVHLYLWVFGLNMYSKGFSPDCSHTLSFSVACCCAPSSGCNMLLEDLWEESSPPVLSVCVLTVPTCSHNFPATGSQGRAALIVQVIEVTQPL